MLYLVNQRLSDLEETYGYKIPTIGEVKENIAKAIEMQSIEDGWLLSILDPFTADVAGNMLNIDIPSIEDKQPNSEFIDISLDVPIDDIVISLIDFMELGDEALSIIIENSNYMQHIYFMSYIKYE